MKQLDKNNVEAWLLDRMEGNLSPEELTRLELFLKQYPEFDEVNEDNSEGNFEEKLILEASQISIKNRAEYSHIGKMAKDDPEWLAFLSAEGLLEPSEEMLFKQLEETNPQLKTEKTLFEKARLESPGVIFTDKASLKRKSTLVPLYVKYVAGVAAMVAVVLSVIPFWNNEISVYTERTEFLNASNVTTDMLNEVFVVQNSFKPKEAVEVNNATTHLASHNDIFIKASDLELLPQKTTLISESDQIKKINHQNIELVELTPSSLKFDKPNLRERAEIALAYSVHQVKKVVKKSDDAPENVGEKVDLALTKGSRFVANIPEKVKLKKKKQFNFLGRIIIIEPIAQL